MIYIKFGPWGEIMMKARCLYYLPLLFIVGATSPVNASPPETVIITTSNTEGVAPLGVHFDVSSVEFNGQVQDPIRDLGYRWNFGDDNGKTWSTNQESKNSDEGFIAAHLFETPGTYEVSVEVSSLDNTFDAIEKTVNITVLDPDEIYPGDNTICFSMEGNFDGCPTGAQQVQLAGDASVIVNMVNAEKFSGLVHKEQRVWNTYKEFVDGFERVDSFEYVDYDEVWDCRSEAMNNKETLMSTAQIKTYLGESKRLLFARGEKFHFYDSLILNNANGSTVGAYGECTGSSAGLCENAPKIEFLAASSSSDMIIIDDQSTAIPQNTDIRISDLSMSRMCGDRNRAINLYDNVSQVMLNRLDITEFDSAIVGRTYGQRAPHDVIGIFNSKFGRMGRGSGIAIEPDNDECNAVEQPHWYSSDGHTPNTSWETEWGVYRSKVEALAENPNCKGGGYNIAYLPAHRHMIMGNTLYDAVTKRAEHILRVSLAHKSLFSHNIFDGPSPNKHAFKLHNMGDCKKSKDPVKDCADNPVQSAENYPTSWVYIHKNLFISNTDIVVNIGPGTSKVGERVNNILFESNQVEASGGLNQVAVNLSGYDSILRNNRFLQLFEEGINNDRSNWNAVVIDQPKYEEDLADNNWVIGNTAKINGSSDFVRLNAGTNGAKIKNNRMCSAESPGFVDLNDSTVSYTAENNFWDCTQPIVHLNFDDESNLALDSVSNIARTVNGEAGFQAGVVNTAASFSAVGDEIILPDPMSSVDDTEEFTVMAWVNVVNFSSGGEVFGRPRVNRQGDVSLGFDAEGKALIYINSVHIYPGIVLQENEWAHLAITFNQASNSAKVYLEGVLKYSHTFPENTNFLFNTGQEFRLGVGQWRSGSKHFSGGVDEFRLYDEELPENVIFQRYQRELIQNN